MVVATMVLAAMATVGVVVLPTASRAATTTQPYELTLGDSYSIGFQPGLGGTPGYSAVLAGQLNMQVENFGCGGATTSSLLHSVDCGDPASQHAVNYSGTTQEQAALDFIAAHPGEVALLTVSIGGNDFDGCSTESCVASAMPAMRANVTSLVQTLDSALSQAHDSAHILGLTYPDVELGLYAFPTHPASAANVASAKSSIASFDKLINPNLNRAYASVPSARFVNVTTARYGKATRGDDTPLTLKQNLPPYGQLPVAAAEICKLTYFCSQGNIHANTMGYNFIGSLLVAKYRSL
jgi:hypothetical protein